MSLNINIYQELIDFANKPNFRTLVGVNLTFFVIQFLEFLDVFFIWAGGRGVLLV